MIRSAVVLGLAFSVFGFCGFKPISQFGVLMATLLGVALVGDLVQTPAILASPVFAWTIARRHGSHPASPRHP